MSRTYKDKPHKLKHNQEISLWEAAYTHQAGVRTKKKKKVDVEWHWMSTPGWWIRLMMNRPERRASKIMERLIVKSSELKDIDTLDLKRKPHDYYW